MRAAARASRAAAREPNVSVHKDTSSDSVPPGFEKAAYAKLASQEAPMWFQDTREWPVLAKKGSSTKDSFTGVACFGAGHSNKT